DRLLLITDYRLPLALAYLAAPTGALTGVIHPCLSAFFPLVTAKNSCWICRVIGPTAPLPTTILSTERIGVTSTAVPTKNTSSAMYNISSGVADSFTG